MTCDAEFFAEVSRLWCCAASLCHVAVCCCFTLCLFIHMFTCISQLFRSRLYVGLPSGRLVNHCNKLRETTLRKISITSIIGDHHFRVHCFIILQDTVLQVFHFLLPGYSSMTTLSVICRLPWFVNLGRGTPGTPLYCPPACKSVLVLDWCV